MLRWQCTLETSPHRVSSWGYQYPSLFMVHTKKEKSRHKWDHQLQVTSECAQREADFWRQFFWHIHPSRHMVWNQALDNLRHRSKLAAPSGGFHHGILSIPYRVRYVFAFTRWYWDWFRKQQDTRALDLELQDKMRNPMEFLAEIQGDTMYFHQAMVQEDSGDFVEAVVK